MTAIARALRVEGWGHIEERRQQSAAVATGGELAQDTMFRLMSTVESANSRELLYRLCVVTGAFGTTEVSAVAEVTPAIHKVHEAYQGLSGLWIEKQASNLWVVCPLLADVGSNELDKQVESAVAKALAELIFAAKTISPLDFSKDILYLKRAKDGAVLGMRLLAGIDSVRKLPRAWQRLIYETTVVDGLLDQCPTTLALLIKGKQLDLARSIGVSTRKHAAEANRLIDLAAPDEQWAVVGYAVQAAPIVAQEDFDEALRLCALVLDRFDDVIEYRNSVVGTESGFKQPFDSEYKWSYPWFFVANIQSASDFAKWLQMIASRPIDEAAAIFEVDLARQGFRLAIDRLWLIEHERPEGERDFGPAVAAYDHAVKFCESRDLKVFHALAVRAELIVFAEYLKDRGKAVGLADVYLQRQEISDEELFLVNEAIGHQYLYAGRTQDAIDHLRTACNVDTRTFDGLRCRAFIDLSRAVGDADRLEALSLTKRAVEIASRNPDEVSELEMVSSLGEAAVAAALDGQYRIAFEYFDAAYEIISREFAATVDWKMRAVFLGNALGYFVAMAATGAPPSPDYAIPRRGQLISYNEKIAAWYDEADYERFNLVPTTLVLFASAVGNRERASYWANKGIDDAREKGVLASIFSLTEALIPSLIADNKLDQALDYAFEASTALVGSMISHRTEGGDIRASNDVNLLLGTKPNDHWRQVEEMHVFLGVLPALTWCCVKDNREALQELETYCSEIASEASDAAQPAAIARAIGMFLAEGRSEELHDYANAETHATVRSAGYLLSSFAADADFRRAILQHAVVMHGCSSRMSSGHLVCAFLTEQLMIFWRRAFQAARFRFISPSLVEEALQNVDVEPPERRVKCLIRIVLHGLGVHMPPTLQATSVWLES